MLTVRVNYSLQYERFADFRCYHLHYLQDSNYQLIDYYLLLIIGRIAVLQRTYTAYIVTDRVSSVICLSVGRSVILVSMTCKACLDNS